MKLTIEIELEERDHPTYTQRVNHALGSLLSEALQGKDLGGEYEYEYVDWGYNGPKDSSITRVRVTKD